MSRYSDALVIQSGVCNPIAVTNSIVRGIEEISKEVGSSPPSDTVLQDPALRLMVHQLAYIFEAHDCFDQMGPEYFGMMETCGKKAGGKLT